MHVRKKKRWRWRDAYCRTLRGNNSTLRSANEDKSKTWVTDGERKRLECTSTEPLEGVEQRSGLKVGGGGVGGTTTDCQVDLAVECLKAWRRNLRPDLQSSHLLPDSLWNFKSVFFCTFFLLRKHILATVRPLKQKRRVLWNLLICIYNLMWQDEYSR